MQGPSREKSQAAIREQFEAAYKQRMAKICSIFQMRYQQLHNSIRSVFDRIKEDELLSAMLNDRTTSVHIDDRVKQIFSEVVAQERELIIRRMDVQMVNLRYEKEELSRQVMRLTESTKNLENEFRTERMTFQQTRNNVSENLRRAQEENYAKLIGLKQKEKELCQLKKVVNHLNQQNSELKIVLKSMEEREEHSNEQGTERESYKDQLKALQRQFDQTKNALAESQQSCRRTERKYQGKKQEFKQKIEEYKSLINRMRNDMSKAEVMQRRWEQQQSDPQKKMSLLVREHEKKLLELKSVHQRQRVIHC